MVFHSLLQLPSVLHILPQIAKRECREPVVHISSSHRRQASFILGVPTVKRKKESYIYQTIKSIISSTSPSDLDDTVIVIYIGERNNEDRKQLATELSTAFDSHIQTGLIDIIAPPACYYPDFDKIPANLGDKRAQFNWRSKQNLDFAYLMMYATSRGKYYVQLEDDIIAADNFITSMRNYIHMQNPEWFLIWFSQLGFIGKCFKTSDLPFFVNFLYLFYRFKPCDWLLDHAIYCMTGCSFNVRKQICHRERNALVKHYRPALFQHVGKYSSLTGKIQRLKEKNFVHSQKKNLFIPHQNNPTANMTTSIKASDKHTLEQAYNGLSYFWGIKPIKGDYMKFHFNPPVKLKTVTIDSGNYQHPSDLLTNAKASILKAGREDKIENYQTVSDFVHGSIQFQFIAHKITYAIAAFRIDILQDAKSWTLIKEIFFDVL
ncbi:uncharacterized protein TRIADDRAFT_30432 [Trichoplax adhaerens]|uniref:Alpha-1,3-mannosyl-glycoprotein 4-beta-N-acetylglucosaminyltransferase B n=1 Tax=Trichoplax adhaerens TaxID=10228 RepID=B3S751_TRIAD|nr:hypothetical protein TRIADDRAFT_30432 [Trichoplax adhaerens]EDV21512.1 hypothetical protein TRIADDRAFT_30432 [Trichoplax adhaerens]|eukprot:XP_002116112.1 hypothetical protein TRIADDRAFT_30432 [Trichoplax adhaerens]